MRAERVRRTRRNDQQITSPRGDDIILDQQVKRAVENVELLSASSTCPMESSRDRDFADYRADSALRAQIDVACEAQNMQYLAELIQHGLGIAILPPASVRAVTAHVATIPITPPLRRDICAVTATRPPAGPAQALLDLLAAEP
jgi:DNA-binding transcriptional LysR family regulator